MTLFDFISDMRFSWLAAGATIVALNAANENAVPEAAKHCYDAPLAPQCTGRVLSILLSSSTMATIGGYVVGLQGGPTIRTAGRSLEEILASENRGPFDNSDMRLIDGIMLALPVVWLLCILAAILAGRFKITEPTWLTSRCVSLMERIHGGISKEVKSEDATAKSIKSESEKVATKSESTRGVRKRR